MEPQESRFACDAFISYIFCAGCSLTQSLPVPLPSSFRSAAILKVPYDGLEIVDIHALDANGAAFLLLTDRDGFYRSLDGGKTWTNFNHGEPRLLQGSKVKPICIGAVSAIYALVDDYGESRNSGGNSLFRYRKRGSMQRLKIALIQLLGGKPEEKIEREK
jgi:hypothetical protein